MFDLFDNPVGVSNDDASIIREETDVWKRVVCSMRAKEWIGSVVVEVVQGADFLKKHNVGLSHKRGLIMKEALPVLRLESCAVPACDGEKTRGGKQGAVRAQGMGAWMVAVLHRHPTLRLAAFS